MIQAVLIQLKQGDDTMKRISNIVFKISALFLSVEFNYSKYENEEETDKNIPTNVSSSTSKGFVNLFGISIIAFIIGNIIFAVLNHPETITYQTLVDLSFNWLNAWGSAMLKSLVK